MNEKGPKASFFVVKKQNSYRKKKFEKVSSKNHKKRRLGRQIENISFLENLF
tara:strand:+ start:339 stop:494 length:156 start_codon:yes stop_codon:yes gene_type:complete